MLHCHVRDGRSFTTICVEEKQMVVELIEGLEEVPFDDSRPKRTTMISTLANRPIRQVLTTFLREN